MCASYSNGVASGEKVTTGWCVTFSRPDTVYVVDDSFPQPSLNG